MSNYVSWGTLETDASVEGVSLKGWATLSAHLDSGSGTLTWEFKGVDGVWRTILGGSDFLTEMEFTASHMVNVFFGTDVNVRCTGSSGSSPVWDWQIMSSVANRS